MDLSGHTSRFNIRKLVLERQIVWDPLEKKYMTIYSCKTFFLTILSPKQIASEMDLNNENVTCHLIDLHMIVECLNL